MAIDDIDNLNNTPDEEGESNLDSIKGDVNSNLNTNLQLVSKIYAELGAEFKNPYMINKELKGKNNEYTKISVVNSELNQKSEPEIAITLQPDGTVILKLNPYNTYDLQIRFVSPKISIEQLESEIKNIKTILQTGEVPQHSTLVKKDPNILNPENLADWVDVYTKAAPQFAQIKANQGK